MQYNFDLVHTSTNFVSSGDCNIIQLKCLLTIQLFLRHPIPHTNCTTSYNQSVFFVPEQFERWTDRWMERVNVARMEGTRMSVCPAFICTYRDHLNLHNNNGGRTHLKV